VDNQHKAFLAEFARGGELIFDNAEQLYREARILRESDALSRALCLHQLSNEECGKLEILGGYAMTVTVGHKFNADQMARVLRNHQAKNHANAYFAHVNDEERAARERGDWARASKVFKETQAKLHEIFNTNKNASLYVDFDGRKFSAPKEVITADLVDEMAVLNEYFLGTTAPYVRLLHRVANNELGFQDAARRYVERMKELRATHPNDPEGAAHTCFQEMLESVKAELEKKQP
jgi:AbiV family abortive infection protein